MDTQVTATPNPPATQKQTNFLLDVCSRAHASDDATYAKCGDLVKLIQTQLKAVEDERVSWVKPLNDQVTRINSQFRLMSEPLKAAKQKVEGLMLQYARAKAARIAAEQAEAARLAERQAEEARKAQAVTAMQRGARTAGSPPPPPPEPPPPPPPPATTTVRGAHSTAGVKWVWKWRVTDLKQVPAEYLLLNEAAVRKAMNAAPKKDDAIDLAIPGIEFFREDAINVR